MTKTEKEEIKEYLKTASFDKKNELKNFCMYSKYFTPSLESKEHIKNYNKAMKYIKYLEKCLKEGDIVG